MVSIGKRFWIFKFKFEDEVLKKAIEKLRLRRKEHIAAYETTCFI